MGDIKNFHVLTKLFLTYALILEPSLYNSAVLHSVIKTLSLRFLLCITELEKLTLASTQDTCPLPFRET